MSRPTRGFLFAWLLLMATSARAGEVRWFGALRAMMHEGKTSAAVQLTDVSPGPHTYAVGALSELRGEVTIVDDRVWLSYPDGSTHLTTVGAPGDEGAALLVAAQVESWEWVVVEREMTLDALAEDLARHAVERKLTEPFVFRIDALFPRLELHVVDGSKIKPGTSPAEHHAAAVQLGSTNVPATLVGFYSTQHAGVFTHHGEATHIHAVLADPLVTGHVDGGVVPEGAILKLPRP